MLRWHWTSSSSSDSTSNGWMCMNRRQLLALAVCLCCSWWCALCMHYYWWSRSASAPAVCCIMLAVGHVCTELGAVQDLKSAMHTFTTSAVLANYGFSMALLRAGSGREMAVACNGCSLEHPA